MKQINVYFEDSEYDELIKKKSDLSWHDFILKMARTFLLTEGDIKLIGEEK